MISTLLLILLLIQGLGSPCVCPPATYDEPEAQDLPRQRHVVVFGTAYQPGPGLRLFGQYVYQGLPGGALSVELGWGGEPFGALSYTQRFELDSLARHRLSLTPSLFSEYEPNRLLNEVETDERRTGGGLYAELQQPSGGPWQYNHFLNLEYARVHLSPTDGEASIHDVTTVATGPRLVRTTPGQMLPADLVLEGRLLGGRDYASDAFFGRARLGARWHRPLGRGFSFETDSRGEWTSAETPVFERASFGGIFSVRGYRPEAALGRAHWTLQQELWIPVPGTMQADRGFGLILREHVRLAAIFDTGGIAATDGPDPAGLRTGTGAGLRLHLGDFTLRADWGHQLTDLQDGNWRGNLFVSIRPDLALFAFE